jgi:hypothetical protein
LKSTIDSEFIATHLCPLTFYPDPADSDVRKILLEIPWAKIIKIADADGEILDTIETMRVN